MSLLTFLPFIVLIGAMFLMTRSAKKKQQQAASMRDSMQPGTGVRTIGGMYATVKELHDDTVLLEVAPGVYAVYAKNAIGAVLSDEEYNHIVHGDEPAEELPAVPDDASSLTEPADEQAEKPKQPEAEQAAGEKPEGKIDLGKKADDATGKDAGAAEAASDEPEDAAPSKDAKADGEK
ncbi:preprotein translocase subunit YajC [Streptomyces sp. NPDC006798]|uniref:preprotein translocase subunit YajC n=1 Tax=Streptomyces sp. NPDC006798 TaxID=3155462 RepID=UPI0033F4DC10